MLLTESLVCGLAIILALLVTRIGAQKYADRKRKTFEISFPNDLSHDQVIAFIRSLSGLPKPKPLFPVYAVSFEVYADAKGKRYFLSIPGHVETEIDNWLMQYIDGASIEPVEDDLVSKHDWHAVELGMWGTHKTLDIKNPKDISSGISACFNTMKDDDAAVMQWIVFRAEPHKPTPETKDKVGDKTFNAVARIGAVGERPNQIIRQVYAGLSITHTFGVKFSKRWSLHTGEKIRQRSGVITYPIFLNATELSSVLGWPFGEFNARIRARHLAPDNAIPREGILIGGSDFPGIRGRPLAISPASLNVHTWCLGPSGSGKSVVLHNMAAQIMQEGMGMLLVEPKGELAEDVLRSVPKDRVNDVVWFDPTDIDHPIGLNVLDSSDPERTTGHIVGMFQTLYSDAWGSRLERILRYSVLTAAVSGLTLYDVKQLLINREFRTRTIRPLKDGELRQFWRWLDDSSDTYVDSVVNKLDSFLGSRAIRNIVGQTQGLDMRSVVRERKILLVPLPAARMGQANASMLGSLLREQYWHETLLRPPGERDTNILMLDEFQNFADFNTSRSDPFAEARSYGLGLIIANQHTDQLGSGVLSSVKANTGSKMVFALDHGDAAKLKDTFKPLSTDDLSHLGKYVVATRLMTATGHAPVATAKTFAPPSPTGYGQPARDASRTRYGRPVREVEAEMYERHRSRDEERKRPSIGRAQ